MGGREEKKAREGKGGGEQCRVRKKAGVKER